jgi:Tol biopolymer transport system component
MVTHIRRRRVLIAALAGAAFAALGVTIASGHAAASAVRNGRIAVTHVSFRHECCAVAEDVLTLEPDGSNPQQLTHSAWGEGSSHPAWGKNNWIYFDRGPLEGLQHLFAMNANGHGVKQVTRGSGSEVTPAPSPDGGLIAFDGYFPEVAPDGAQGIYLTARAGGSYGDFRRLTFAPQGGFDTSPDFSPNGRTIAFRRVLGDSPPNAMSAVFVIGLDGSGLRQLTPYSLDAVYPRWSPDGTRLVFSTNRDDNTDEVRQDVWTVNADGSGLTQLTHEPVGNQSFLPDWSPDGTKIVFAHFLPTGFFTQLRVMNADGSNVRVIWQGADFTYDVRPAWDSRP